MQTTFHPKPAHFEKKNQVCPNSLIFHRKMSDSAIRFVLALNGIWMNSRTWVPVQSDLAKRLNWGKKKMTRIIQECVELGYLKVTQNRDKKGLFNPNQFEFDIEGKYNENKEETECYPCAKNGSRINEENLHSEECPDDTFSTDNPNQRPENDPLPCSFMTNNLVLLANQETNKQEEKDLFVCSFDENQKKIIELLKPHAFPDIEIHRMFGLPAEQIENALLAYEQYRKGREIDNPIGCIKTAILGAWKPNKTKVDLEKEKELIEKNLKSKVDENQVFAENLIKKYYNKFTNEFSISFSGLAINLKSKTGVYPLSIMDADFKNVLEWFVESNINK